jgi:hypothetical protein
MTKDGVTSLRQLLELADLAGSTRYLKTPAFGAIAPLTISGPQTIRFTRDGFVTAFSGQIQSGAAADYAAAALRVQIGGQEDLFVDGQGAPAFAGFLELFGGVPARRRIVRRVVRGDLWTFTVQNLFAAVTSITPTVTLDILDDEDLAKLMSALPGGQPAR